MNLSFHNKRITGMLTIVPAEEIKFEDEMENYNFSTAKSLKLKAAMGYNARRIVKEGVCVSDLCIHGLNYVFDNGFLAREDIDALILVTQSPDYLMPATSSVIQGHFGLKQDMICMDISQGCAGYIIGIFQAFMLLEQEEINKVVLLNADVLSRKVSKKDRNSSPLIGDAASLTILEKAEGSGRITGNIRMDGTGATALMIPAGGFKLPSSAATAELKEDSAGNFRSLDNLVMKGDEVFNFVQREVPPMIERLLEKAGVGRDEVDYYMFHQPNKFMLNKLADKLNIPREKMPSNIVESFGNSSGVSIPMAITYNLKDTLKDKDYRMCLAGFGVGLTWASLLITIGHLDFCAITEF